MVLFGSVITSYDNIDHLVLFDREKNHNDSFHFDVKCYYFASILLSLYNQEKKDDYVINDYFLFYLEENQDNV